jgi:hypothetical protein
MERARRERRMSGRLLGMVWIFSARNGDLL